MGFSKLYEVTPADRVLKTTPVTYRRTEYYYCVGTSGSEDEPVTAVKTICLSVSRSSFVLNFYSYLAQCTVACNAPDVSHCHLKSMTDWLFWIAVEDGVDG